MIYPIYTSWGTVESEDDLSHVKSIMALSGSDGQVQSRIEAIEDLSELWSLWGYNATEILMASGSSLIFIDALDGSSSHRRWYSLSGAESLTAAKTSFYNGVPVWNWLPVKEMLYTIEENTVVFSIAKR
jgi:hypothetical protein